MKTESECRNNKGQQRPDPVNLGERSTAGVLLTVLRRHTPSSHQDSVLVGHRTLVAQFAAYRCGWPFKCNFNLMSRCVTSCLLLQWSDCHLVRVMWVTVTEILRDLRETEEVSFLWWKPRAFALMCMQRAFHCHCPKGVYSVSEAGDFSEKSDTKEVCGRIDQSDRGRQW